jgi:Protein of unknown function (DUF664)
MRCPGSRQSNTLPDSQPTGALQIPRVRSGRATHGPRNRFSTRSAIGLIKHAAAGERIWFQHYLSGLPEAECDGYAQGGEGSFADSEDETLSNVIAEFERASRRSRSIAEPYDLEHTVQHPRAGTVNLRFIYLLGIEDLRVTPATPTFLSSRSTTHKPRTSRPARTSRRPSPSPSPSPSPTRQPRKQPGLLRQHHHRPETASKSHAPRRSQDLPRPLRHLRL